MSKSMLDRRNFLLAGAAAGTAGSAALAALHDGELGGPPQIIQGGMPWTEGLADAPPGAAGSGYSFFSGAEASAIEAIVDRLIPPDATGPGAVEAGVPFFLDRQLAGLYGRGDHYFLGGPWPKGTPEQGYQTRFSPAQYYRAALSEIDKYASNNFKGSVFAKLSASDQDSVLKRARKRVDQAWQWRREQNLFHAPSSKCEGRLFFGSDLRRKQEHGRVEDDRVSRRSL